MSAQGRVLDVNAQGAALLASAPQVLTGRSLTQAVAPAFQATFTALLGRVFEHRGRQTGEVQVLLPSGQVLDLILEATLQGREGEPDGCHLTATDVTAFKAAHRVLLDANQAQERQLQDQRHQVRRLEEEFESVMLLSGRELGSTLTRAGSLLEQPPSQEGAATLTHAQEALRQTQGILESLKRYMQARGIRARPRSVDLGKVLREVLKDAQPQMAGRNVRVSHAPLPILQGDS